MRYNAAPERRAAIEKVLRSSGYVSSAEMSGKIGVSEMTIRRDLRLMETMGVVRRVAGGAMLRTQGGLSFERRDSIGAAQKHAIAEASARIVQGAAMVAIDAGTTAAGVAPLIEEAMVVTHSLPVISTMASQAPDRLISLGGHYQPATRSFTGPIATATLRDMHCDFALISAAAVNPQGTWSINVLEANIKRALIEHSRTVVLMADASKVGRTAPLKVADWGEIDIMVTGRGADSEVLDSIRAHDVEVRLVG